MYEPRYLEKLKKLLERSKGVVNKKQIARLSGKTISTFVYDINCDGVPEIVVSIKGGDVYALDITGNILWKFQAQDSVFGIAAKHLGPNKECIIALGSDDDYVYVLNENGSVIWSYKALGWVSSTAISDLSKDGQTHIYAGSDDGFVYAFNINGNLEWKYKTFGKVKKIRISDIDNDGKDEIIAISYDKYLHILDSKGRIKRKVPTWNQAGREFYIADIDKDGFKEIIVVTFEGCVYLYSNKGELRWTYKTRGKARNLFATDIDQDNSIEIIVGSEGGFLHILTPKGELKWAEQFNTRFFYVDSSYTFETPRLLLGIGDSLQFYETGKISGLTSNIRDCFSIFGNLDRIRNFFDTESFGILSNIALSNAIAQKPDISFYIKIEQEKAFNEPEHHIFISYIRDDTSLVENLCAELNKQGINVWIDRENLYPGQRWRQAIRRAIRDGAYFVACFSTKYAMKTKTYMNEEILLAIEELRQRPTDRVWFIPVKLSECEIPDRDIGGGETLNDLHYVELYENWADGINKIIGVVKINN
jgi:outer membrane protein assembly factor BamB